MNAAQAQLAQANAQVSQKSAAVTVARHAARHPVPSGDGGVWGETGGSSRLLPAGPTAPNPKADGRHPPQGSLNLRAGTR